MTVGDVTRTWEMRGRRGGRPRDDEALWVATVEKGAPSPRVLVDARTRSGLAQGGSTLLDGAEQAVRRHARASDRRCQRLLPSRPSRPSPTLARGAGAHVGLRRQKEAEAAPAAKRKPEVASTAPDAAAALVAAPPQLTDETPLTAVEQRIFSELGAVSKESATTACAVVKFKSGVDGSAFYVAAASPSTSGAAPVPWAGLAVSSTPTVEFTRSRRRASQSHAGFRRGGVALLDAQNAWILRAPEQARFPPFPYIEVTVRGSSVAEREDATQPVLFFT